MMTFVERTKGSIMTAVSVTTDLTAIANANNTTDTQGGTWVESSNNAFDNQATPGQETDFYIQGSNCISQQCTKTDIGSILYEDTYPTESTGDCWFMWHKFDNIGLQSTTASDGAVMHFENNAGNAYNYWNVGGSDAAPAPEGGWYMYVLDFNDGPTADTIVGTVGTPVRWGMMVNTGAGSRGYPHAMGGIYHGQGQAIVTGGTTPDAAAVFSDISDTLAEFDDSGFTRRYGIFEATGGGFDWMGKILLGTSGSAVRFSDSNKNIFIKNTPFVNTSFNEVIVDNASSDITMSGVTFQNTGVGVTIPGATNSRGDWTTNNNPTVSLSNCAFVDMGTFSFGSNTTIEDTAFRRCDQVTGNGATFTRATFRDTIGDAALLETGANVNANLDECTFVGDGTSHAIEITDALDTSTINWNGNFSGTYAGSSAGPNATSTSGDSEHFLVNVNSGQTLTISVASGAGTPTVRNIGPGSVSVVGASVYFELTGLKDGTEVRLIDIDASPITEIAGVENIGLSPEGINNGSGTVTITDATDNNTFRYTYQYSSNVNMRVQIISQEYEIINLEGGSYFLGNTSKSFPVSQVTDRNYLQGSVP